jgi:hypothetical protein
MYARTVTPGATNEFKKTKAVSLINLFLKNVPPALINADKCGEYSTQKVLIIDETRAS